jgi:WD40 repeat protein
VGGGRIEFGDDEERIKALARTLTIAKEGGAVRECQAHGDLVACVAISPDGQTIATGGNDKAVILWDVSTCRERLPLGGHSSDKVLKAIFSPGGNLVASWADRDQAVVLWNARTGQVVGTLRGHSHPVAAAVFRRDDKTLVSVDEMGGLRVWNLATKRATVHDLHGEYPVISPEGATVACRKGDEVCVWSVALGQEVCTLSVFGTALTPLSFGPDEKTLVCDEYSRVTNTYQGRSLWDTENGKRIAPAGRPAKSFQTVTFSPDKQLVATGEHDGRVMVWQIQAAGVKLAFDGPAQALAFSPDGTALAAGAGDEVLLYDVKSGRRLGSLEGSAKSLKFSPDGRSLAGLSLHTGSATICRLWDVTTSRTILNFRDQLHRIQFSPNSRFLALGGLDEDVRLYDARSGVELGFFRYKKYPPRNCPVVEPSAIQDLAFSPDCKTLVSVNETLKFWDVSKR